MISIARGLGAPETVPAGKVAASTSRASRPVGDLAGDRRDQVHDVAVALDPHEVDDLDGARHADPAQVVAGQVDEHHVLGPLLGVGEQLLGEPDVLLRRRPARPGAGGRVHDGRGRP